MTLYKKMISWQVSGVYKFGKILNYGYNYRKMKNYNKNQLKNQLKVTLKASFSFFIKFDDL